MSTLLTLLVACAPEAAQPAAAEVTPPPPLGALTIPAGEQPQRWEAEIQASIAARGDVQRPLVFVGSSSVRLWGSLAEDMAPFEAVNHGFGGSRIFDAVFWLEAVLEAVKPRALVVFSGTNDLAGEAPREVDYLVQQFDALVARMRALGHDVPLFYLAISPTPARERHLERVLEANRRLAARCADDPQLHFVDTASALLDADGRPDPRWFVADRLHLNADGYASWTATLRPALQRVLADQRLQSRKSMRVEFKTDGT